MDITDASHERRAGAELETDVFDFGLRLVSDSHTVLGTAEVARSRMSDASFERDVSVLCWREARHAPRGRCSRAS